MPRFKLYYFNLRGRAEPIRLIFKAAGVEFEDKRLTSEEWAKLKSSSKAPCGQMPLLEVDEKILAQSIAIGRYVANEVGLAPSSNLEKAQADMLCDGCTDLSTKFMMAFLEKDEAKKEIRIPEYPENFFSVARLSTNNNLNGRWRRVRDPNQSHTCGTQGPLPLFKKLFAKGKQEVPVELTAFPLLEGHYERVMNVPNIKKWLEERPASDI